MTEGIGSTTDLETRIQTAPNDEALDNLLHELAVFQNEDEQQRLIAAVAKRRTELRELAVLHAIPGQADDPTAKATVPMQRADVTGPKQPRAATTGADSADAAQLAADARALADKAAQHAQRDRERST